MTEAELRCPRSSSLTRQQQNSFDEKIDDRDVSKEENLLEHVQRIKQNSYQQLIAEYESVPRILDYPTNIGKSKKNVKLNNFGDVVPYDYNRVVLPHHSADYINASYITVRDPGPNYILAQAPKESSLESFLHLICEEQVQCIVMLNNVVEKDKLCCSQYWPETEASQLKIGKYKVSCRGKLVKTYYIVRQLEIESVTKRQRVMHYHYTAWPDKGVPSLCEGILQLLTEVEEAGFHEPILAHCRAGVGRSGTFLTLHSLLHASRITPLGSGSVLQMLRVMREQRMLAVQTTNQYVFLYDALLESELQMRFAPMQFCTWITTNFALRTLSRVHQVLYLTTIPFEGGHPAQNELQDRSLQQCSSLQPCCWPDTFSLDSWGKQMTLRALPLRATDNDVWQTIYEQRYQFVIVVKSTEEEKYMCLRVPRETISLNESKHLLVECSFGESGESTDVFCNVELLAMDTSAKFKPKRSASTGFSFIYREIVSSLHCSESLLNPLKLLMQSRKVLLACNCPHIRAVLATAVLAIVSAHRCRLVDVYSAAKQYCLRAQTGVSEKDFVRAHQLVARYLQWSGYDVD